MRSFKLASFASLSSIALVVASLAMSSASCGRPAAATVAGCTYEKGPHGTSGNDPSAAAPTTAVANAANAPSDAAVSESANALFREAKRELSLVRVTNYKHETNVNEESGLFEFDCSGFVSYALRAAAPSALTAIPVGKKGRSRAEDYVAYFSELASMKTPQPWIAVARASELRPGDVVAWIRPDDVDNNNTGHMAIVSADASSCGNSAVASAIGGSGEWLVRVIDSTQSPHGDDVRKKDEAMGLGSGTLGLVVDGAGAPIGYRWKGGVSDKAHATRIVLARLR